MPGVTFVSNRCSPVTISLATGRRVMAEGRSPESRALSTVARPAVRAATSAGEGGSGCSGTVSLSVMRPSALWLPSETFRMRL